MKNKPKARYTDIVVSDYKDELLLYDLKTHKCHSLNKTAASVWQVCDGNRDVTAIAEKLFAKAPKGERDKLVLLALNELTKAGLIETDDFAFRSLATRRQLIIDAGKATMIALPIVASVTAPAAGNAQSCANTVCSSVCCNNSSPCDSNGSCCPAARACPNECCSSSVICFNGICT